MTIRTWGFTFRWPPGWPPTWPLFWQVPRDVPADMRENERALMLADAKLRTAYERLARAEAANRNAGA